MDHCQIYLNSAENIATLPPNSDSSTATISGTQIGPKLCVMWTAMQQPESQWYTECQIKKQDKSLGFINFPGSQRWDELADAMNHHTTTQHHWPWTVILFIELLKLFEFEGMCLICNQVNATIFKSPKYYPGIAKCDQWGMWGDPDLMVIIQNLSVYW